MSLITLENFWHSLNAIVPVVKVSLDGTPSLIGTAFFVTTSGVICTAKHVIADNFDIAGNDVGGIGIIHLNGPALGTYRPLRTSYFHPTADIAIAELGTQVIRAGTGEIIGPLLLGLSVEPISIAEPISSHFFHSISLVPNRDIPNELTNPLKSYSISFQAEFVSRGASPPTTAGMVKVELAGRITHGKIHNYFPNGRDTVMLPFSVWQSDMPIYGGASGGPVFDSRGRVIGINCTRFEGADISYHTDITHLLECVLPNTVTPDDPVPKPRYLAELARLHAISVAGLDAALGAEQPRTGNP